MGPQPDNENQEHDYELMFDELFSENFNLTREFDNSTRPKNDDKAIEKVESREQQNHRLRNTLFKTINIIIIGYALASTIFVGWSFFWIESSDLRYVIIAYMSTMIIEIIGVMHVVAKSLFPQKKQSKK